MAGSAQHPLNMLVWLGWAAAVSLIGCGGCGAESSAGAGGGALQSAAQGGGTAETYQPAVHLVDELPRCDVEHRGLLLDLGSDDLAGRFGWRLDVPEGVASSDHQGASWARIYDRKLELTFHLSEVTPVFVSARVRGKDSRQAVVSIDGQLVGTIKLSRDEVRIGSTRTTSVPLDSGIHRLQLRFRGRKASGAEPFAEFDWIRIGVPDELERAYGAPTQFDVRAPAAELGGVPHRALALRAPGVIRCALRVPEGARLRTAVGMRGAGRATVAIRARADGQPAKVLQWTEVEGGDSAAWTDIDLPLDAFASKIVALELASTKATGPGRLLFGDPVIAVPQPRRSGTARAQTVVIVVLDGVEREDLAPWRGTITPHLPTLTQLVPQVTVFDQHRVPSGLVAGVMASFLSGSSPRSHRLADPGARLPESVLTLGAMARNASVRAAMFTGVPSTFKAFGFGEGWDRFTEYAPNGGRLASAPIDDALEWLEDVPPAGEARHPMLVVVHARGGHPPWELTPAESATLPPADYTGYFSARRAAQSIADVRERRGRLSEADRERMRALFLAGLGRQDEALGRLVAELHDSGRWESTLFIVMGDLSSARRTLFADGVDPDEAALTVPLLVRFPAGTRAGERVDRPTEIYDVARTALVALGITPPPEMLGRDLARVASGPSGAPSALRVAYTDERYSARWGRFVLKGTEGSEPRLCDVTLDPTCSADRKAAFPIVTQAIFRQLASFTARRPVAARREPVTIDSDTAAMLNVWGAY